MLALVAFAGGARAGNIWFEAEQFSRSNWPGGKAGSGWFAPANTTEAAKLSGGKWLNTGAPGGILFTEYDLTIPSAGTYTLYARRFWHHGPFKWRMDRGAWTETAGRVPLLDSVPLRKDVVANWTSLGPITLTAGRHVFRVELLKATGAAAFDCFLLTDEPFSPRGALKPGEKTGLHGEGSWAFEPGVDLFGDECGLDLRYLNEDVAGQSGRVTCRGGRFYLGDGQPVRFWGTNLGTHRMGLPALRYQARRLAKLGVNHVRFFQSMQPQSPDSSVTDVNEELIANCHRVVAAMKEEGVYTTICPFFVLRLQVHPKWNVPGYPDGVDKPFGLLFWDKTLQRGYKAWVRELLTRPNPHTGIPLAKDPAVHVFQIQNEDSLFFWTFMKNVNLTSQAVLGKSYGDWLAARYGSLAGAVKAWGGPRTRITRDTHLIGDHFDRGVAGFLPMYNMTGRYSGSMNRRVSDQIEFLAHAQRAFNTEMTAYIRQLGYEGLISANVWRAADPLTLMDVERYTYTTNEVIDRHHYVTATHVNPDTPRRTGYTIEPGDLFVSESALKRPRSLPTNYKMISGSPHIVTECTWPQPNRFKAEAPLLVAAYGAMTDLDGFFWFASGATDYEPAMTKFQVNVPSIMGQFPATALLYRQGLVAEAPVVVRQQRPLADLWARKFPIIAEDAGYDPNRDLARPGLTPSAVVDPLAYLVGRVEVTYGGASNEHAVAAMDRFIDRTNKTVVSAAGEVKLNYGSGLLTINAPAAQGVAGFLAEAGEVKLHTIDIRSGNEYGSILAVPLDGKPLEQSRKILLQTATEEQLYEFSASNAPVSSGRGDAKRTQPGKRIDNLGRAPWNVVNIDATVTVRNPALHKATALDELGYPLRTLEVTTDDGAVTVTLPPASLYTILE